jgi:hypothetical protein
MVDTGHARAPASVITRALCGRAAGQTRSNLRYAGAATLQPGWASSGSMICQAVRWLALVAGLDRLADSRRAAVLPAKDAAEATSMHSVGRPASLQSNGVCARPPSAGRHGSPASCRRQSSFAQLRLDTHRLRHVLVLVLTRYAIEQRRYGRLVLLMSGSELSWRSRGRSIHTRP